MMENKNNQAQNLSEAVRTISIENLAVSKAVEKIPSFGVDLSKQKIITKIKTIATDEEDVTNDTSYSIEFGRKSKHSKIATLVHDQQVNTTDHMSVTKDMIKTRVFNTSYKNTVYQSIEDEKITTVELKDTKVRLGVNTGTLSKTLKKSNNVSRKTSKLIKSSSAVQNGESTIDKEIGKEVKNSTIRYAGKHTGKAVKRLMNPIITWLKQTVKKILSKIVGAFGMLLIPVIVVCVCAASVSSIFGGSGGNEVITQYENYFNTWTEKYDSEVGMFEQNHPDGSIICNYGTRGRCDWKAVLSLIQAIFEDPSYSNEEQELLKLFEKQNSTQGLYEKHIQKNEGNSYSLEITNATFDDYVSCIKNNTNYLNNEKLEIAKEYYQSEEFLMDFGDTFQIRYSGDDVTGGVVVSGDSEKGNLIANKALTRVGYIYVWGGCHNMSQIKDPAWTKFDCSGLVCWSYYQAGVNIGSQTTKSLSKMGQQISFSQLQPGDILLYSSDGTYNGIHHVTIYIGGGRVVHAPSRGKAITTKSVNSDKKHLYSCRRLY